MQQERKLPIKRKLGLIVVAPDDGFAIINFCLANSTSELGEGRILPIELQDKLAWVVTQKGLALRHEK